MPAKGQRIGGSHAANGAGRAMPPVGLPEEWHEFLKARRKRTGAVIWRQVVAALEIAFGKEPGAPPPLGPPARRARA